MAQKGIISDGFGKTRASEITFEEVTFGINEYEEHISLDNLSKETVGAIFHSIKAVFTHPVSFFGELLFLILCSLAFLSAPELRERYQDAPTNIIIVVLFIMIVVVSIRLFYVGDLISRFIKKYGWWILGIIFIAFISISIRLGAF